LHGLLAGGGVDSDIGHVVAPLVGLRLEVGEIPKGSEWPEVVSDVVDGAFLHFPLLLRLGHVAGNGGDVEGPQKLQKMFIETHDGALPLQHRGEHVVMDEFFGGALEKVKRMQEATVQGLLPLRVGKLQIQ
jgi:hypothetical protein